VARFDWTNVEHDVLKVLYESVIGAETRRRLGEYYTPDWLADQIVATTVTDPSRSAGPRSGLRSGTFLFHAVRRYLKPADEAEVPLADALSEPRRSLPRLFAERMVEVVAVVLIASARLQSGPVPGTSLQPLVT
jgi:hypothetical protein